MERFRYAEKNDTRMGTVGWGLLAAGVVAWDIYASETLTHAARRGLADRRARPIIMGAVALTSLHLLDRMPTNAVDPFVVAEKLSKAALEVYRQIT